MFDKLIESNTAEAEFKPRRKFFMMSSVVVGILFLSAVVFSLYAQDIGLGTDNFEIAELLAPIATDAPKPEPVRQQSQQNNKQEITELPNRQDLVAHINHLTTNPPVISTTPLKGLTIPDAGRFTNDVGRPDSEGIGGTPAGTGRAPVGTSSADTGMAAEVITLPEPPPVVAKKAEPKVARVVSEGVINGKALHLPTPAYPAPAKLIGADGIVNVQVTIDEDGRVISSKAVTGHPLLRRTAESAAWKAKFSTTYLSRVPVKVTGVIVFNFKRN